MIELDDQGQRLGGDELGDRVSGQLAFEINAVVIKLKCLRKFSHAA